MSFKYLDDGKISVDYMYRTKQGQMICSWLITAMAEELMKEVADCDFLQRCG